MTSPVRRRIVNGLFLNFYGRNREARFWIEEQNPRTGRWKLAMVCDTTARTRQHARYDQTFDAEHKAMTALNRLRMADNPIVVYCDPPLPEVRNRRKTRKRVEKPERAMVIGK